MTKVTECQDEIEAAIRIMKSKGRVMQSGEMEIDGKLYTYKFKELKRKPTLGNDSK